MWLIAFLRISDLSERVYVFGEPDWKPPSHPNMRVVKLKPDAKLAREWMVIANSKNFHSALVAVDETASLRPSSISAISAPSNPPTRLSSPGSPMPPKI
jgi:DICT domain-containing protein